ncbi:MAG: hypothetical protein QXR60_01175 [Candidatus Nanoarchaeia archaeon]
MAPLNLSETLEIPNFSLSELTNISFGEYMEIIQPLLFFVVGIALYSIFIFTFYKFMARRDVVGKFHDTSKYEEGLSKLIDFLMYILRNLILTPLFVFFWFFVMVMLVAFLTKNPTTNSVLITSISLVAAIRIAAYYNRNLAEDLAKMLPFVLLGVFLVDASYFSLETSLSVLLKLPQLWKILVYYMLFVIAIEFILRIMHGAASLLVKREED